MAEYIERGAFREVLAKSHKSHAENCRDAVLLARDIRLLNEQPTADVAEVVRCKDCKYNVANWQHDSLDCTDYTDITCDYFMTDGMDGNDFCSRGERIEK